MKDTKKLGINCKERSGMINVGLHLPTILLNLGCSPEIISQATEQMKGSLSVSNWYNFGVVKRESPTDTGYTHFPIEIPKGQ